jgi:hypothetical protein
MPSPKKQSLPKGFYDKGKELLAEAQKIEHEDLQREAIKAALRYYDADISQDRRLLTGVIVLFLLVVGAIVLAFEKLEFLSAVVVVALAFTFFSLLVGVMLRALGYISENSLMAIWREGFKVLRDIIKAREKKTDSC